MFLCDAERCGSHPDPSFIRLLLPVVVLGSLLVALLLLCMGRNHKGLLL